MVIVYLSIGKCSAKAIGVGKRINVLKKPKIADTIANAIKSNTFKNTEINIIYNQVIT